MCSVAGYASNGRNANLSYQMGYSSAITIRCHKMGNKLCQHLS